MSVSAHVVAKLEWTTKWITYQSVVFIFSFKVIIFLYEAINRRRNQAGVWKTRQIVCTYVCYLCRLKPLIKSIANQQPNMMIENNILQLTPATKIYMKKSLAFNGALIWNSLSLELKKSCSLMSFQNKIAAFPNNFVIVKCKYLANFVLYGMQFNVLWNVIFNLVFLLNSFP